MLKHTAGLGVVPSLLQGHDEDASRELSISALVQEASTRLGRFPGHWHLR